MASPTGAGWAQLRQQARQLESQTESLFHTYSQYTSMSNIPAKPSEEEQRTEQQIDEILEKREEVITSLSRLLDSDPQPSALKSSHLARHRETLAQNKQDLSRLKSQLSSARDRANLLTSVRNDISVYHRSSPAQANAQHDVDPGAAEADYMLDERTRIDRSNNMADSLLSQAYAVNESFTVQREQLDRVRRRIMGAVSTVPGINGLIGRIGSKKRRDGIILGSFIALCCLVVLYFI